MKDRRPKTAGKAEEIAPGVPLDDFVPYLLNRIAARLNRDLAEDLKSIDQSLQAYRVLAVLAIRGARSIGELCVYTVTEQPTLSRILERMERDGLVRRAAAESDGRIVLVSITEAGRRAFKEIRPIAQHHYQRAVAGLSEAEHKTLVDLLHKVLNSTRRSPYP